MRQLLAFALLFSGLSLYSADIPGGVTRISDGLTVNTYEVALAPAYTLKPGGAYLSSEIRYQANEDFGAGLGFGAGEVGFNFGVSGIWYIAPDVESQPGFSISGGLYLNRISKEQKDLLTGKEVSSTDNYFAVRIVPTLSKAIRQDWGKITPYGALQATPSFRLGQAENEFSLRTSVGAQFDIKALQGVRLYSEVGLAVMNSNSEIVFGLSYPFKAL